MRRRYITADESVIFELIRLRITLAGTIFWEVSVIGNEYGLGAREAQRATWHPQKSRSGRQNPNSYPQKLDATRTCIGRDTCQICRSPIHIRRSIMQPVSVSAETLARSAEPLFISAESQPLQGDLILPPLVEFHFTVVLPILYVAQKRA